MKSFSNLFTALALVALAALSLPALAQANADLTSGEVRKVDKEASKITIKHAEIKSLDMPAMTMVFTVKDPALLEKAKPGEKLKFVVVREEGKFVVTDIQPDIHSR